MDFVEFPKIPRLNREVIVTEKIDGTNASVLVTEQSPQTPEAVRLCVATVEHRGGLFYLFAGSRTRWITPEGDNFGFARWVSDNASELVKLGEGTHFGEWWGQGIQRGYGLPEKRWSLFNTSRWTDERPACCGVVPVLARGIMGRDFQISTVHERLATLGSVAAPGFMKPEGYVIFHTAANSGFKVTLEKDEEWKGKQRAA